MHWIKKVQKAFYVFIFFAILLFVGLLLLEGLIRILPAGRVIDRPHESLGYYEQVPERVIDIKPNVTKGAISFYGEEFPLWSNDLGCFDEAYEGEKPFIYLAGDSLSWGYVEFEDKWGTQLQNILGMRILKCAVSASGTYHQYLKAKGILAEHPNPKLILVGYFSQNDVLDDYYFPQFVYRGGERVDNLTPGEMPTEEVYAEIDKKLANHRAYCMTDKPSFAFFYRIKCFLYNHSALYVLTTQGIKSILGIEVYKNTSVFPLPPEEAFNKHFEAIKDFRNLAAEQGARTVFVMIPSREEVYPELFGEVSSSTKNKSIAYFKSQGIDFIDLQPVFREIADKRNEMNVGKPGDLYWPIEWHLNPLGNYATAYATARYLYDHNLIQEKEDLKKILDVFEKKLYEK